MTAGTIWTSEIAQTTNVSENEDMRREKNESSKSKAEKTSLRSMVQKTKEDNSEIMEAPRNLGEWKPCK